MPTTIFPPQQQQQYNLPLHQQRPVFNSSNKPRLNNKLPQPNLTPTQQQQQQQQLSRHNNSLLLSCLL
jgi:hypothetical protein